MLLDSVLDFNECEEIVKEFDQTENKTIESRQFYYNSVGAHNLKSSLKFLNKVDKLAKTIFPNIEFQNVYAREYKEESFLKIHRDRTGLDLTFSICIENKNNITWPIHISNKECFDNYELFHNSESWKEEYQSIYSNVGQAILLKGRQFPHWRDRFPGTTGQRMVYVFYHWKFI